MSYQNMCITILPAYCPKSHVRPETDPRSGVGQSLSQLGVLGQAFPHVGIEFDHGVRVEFLAPKFWWLLEQEIKLPTRSTYISPLAIFQGREHDDKEFRVFMGFL